MYIINDSPALEDRSFIYHFNGFHESGYLTPGQSYSKVHCIEYCTPISVSYLQGNSATFCGSPVYDGYSDNLNCGLDFDNFKLESRIKNKTSLYPNPTTGIFQYQSNTGYCGPVHSANPALPVPDRKSRNR